MRIKFFAFCFSVAATYVFMMAPVSAVAARQNSKPEQTSKISDVLTIPVSYVTDRELTGDTFGPHRRYSTDCQHHMYYGTAFVDVQNTEDKHDDALLKSLDWKVAHQKTSKISPKEKIDSTDPDRSKDQFFDRLRKILDQSGKPELVLFVHGAADGFEDCAKDAAQLAYAMQKPVILYSWPSDPRLRGYFIDSNDVEWSQGHFDQFLKDLMKFQSEHPLEVISVSHSMGNRLVVRSLPVVYGKNLVKDWEIVSPDMDADTCRHYTLGLTQLNSRLRLYVSNKDKALPLAQMLSGGYYRLGEAANPTYGKPGGKSNLFERIDFTVVDKGLTGHSIPFDLISNFVSTDKPGPGLELVDESSINGNKLSRFAGKSENFSRTSVESAFTKRVVKTNLK